MTKILRTRGRLVAIAGAAAALTVTLGTGLVAQTMTINGGESTFGNPIYTKWFSEYNKLHSNVQINYASQGSGFGIQQIQKQTIFFGATDAPMTNEQLAGASGGAIFHFPTVLGGVVPMYNIPGVTAELKFTGQVLADIYLGKITKWNDPAIGKLNPGVNFPNTDITVVHRSDGSGTTYIWCDYLSQISPEYKSKIGVATSVNWPVGLGGTHSEGVSGIIKQTPGAIGYVELIYALQNKVPYGIVQNAAGKFVKATLETVTAAAAGAVAKMPADFRVSIVNAPGADAYPISSFTWIVMYQSPKDLAMSKTFVDFMKWALSDGQKFAADLGYAPLAPGVIKLEMAQLAKVKVQ